MSGMSRLKQLFEAKLASQGQLGRTLIKAALGSSGIKLAYTGIGFVTAILMARMLTPAGYGVYSFAMALAGFLAIPSQLGIPTLATRELAVTNASHDWGHMRGFITWAHKATALFSVSLLGIGVTALWLLRQTTSSEQLQCMALAFLLIPLISLGALRNGMLRGLRKVVLSQLPERIIKPSIVLVAITLLLLSGEENLSPTSAILVQIFASALAFAFGLYYFIRSAPSELSTAEAQFKSRSWLKSTIPVALMAAMQTINGQTDILALGLFREDAEVGIYRVAVQLATAVIFGLQIVNLIQAPHIAHLYAKNDMQRLQRLITKSSQGMLLATLPVVTVLIVFGQQIIELAFGHAYQAAYVPLLILCAGQVVNAAMGSVRSVLNMTGNEHDTTRSLVIGAIFNVVLNLMLTPIWGMNGAAVATATTLVVWNILMWRAVRAKTGLETSPFFRRTR
jgi:O-antigen/teichoic acid export membrane protein